jgi:hypothetical protein
MRWQELNSLARVKALVAPLNAVEDAQAHFVDLPQLPLDRATIPMSHERGIFANAEEAIDRASGRCRNECLPGEIPVSRLAPFERAVGEQKHWAAARSLRGQIDPAVAHQEFHVFPNIFLGRGVSQKVRRMVGAHDLGAAVLEDSTAELADGVGQSEEILGRNAPQADDVVGIDDFD